MLLGIEPRVSRSSFQMYSLLSYDWQAISHLCHTIDHAMTRRPNMLDSSVHMYVVDYVW